jgi:hypothetical protein
MTRSRRSTRATRPAASAAPAATLHDAAAVVRITDAAVRAITTTAAEYGLDGAPWDPDVLHREVSRIVATALRHTPGWWADRTGEGSC